jgi:hypothetical protein
VQRTAVSKFGNEGEQIFSHKILNTAPLAGFGARVAITRGFRFALDGVD